MLYEFWKNIKLIKSIERSSKVIIPSNKIENKVQKTIESIFIGFHKEYYM